MDRLILILKYALVAFVQGVAEILPISSSGHMAIVQELIGIESSELTFEVFLHFASLIAIVFFFRKRLFELIRDFFVYIFKRPEDEEKCLVVKKNFWLCILIVVATIPAGIAGILLEDIIAEHCSVLWFIGLMLLITSLGLFLSTKISRIRQVSDLKWYQALVIGLFQVCGIFPGISRSGSCIVGASTQKVEQSDAAEFAFILAIPVMLGSAVFKVGDVAQAFKQTDLIIPYLIAFIITLVTTYVALRFFLKIVRKQKLTYFSIYCALMGITTIVLYFIL